MCDLFYKLAHYAIGFCTDLEREDKALMLS